MEKRRLFCARHGHREDFVGDDWSPEWGLTHDRPHDPGLSELGFAQARALGKALSTSGIQHAFASPFLRTAQTGHCISESIGIRVNLEPGLSEWLHPFWYPKRPELLAPTELEKRYPAIDPDYTPIRSLNYPEPVELVDVWPRVVETTLEILRRTEGDVLVVSHASPIEGLVRWFTGTSDSVHVPMCGLYVFEGDGEEWELKVCGSTVPVTG